MNQHELIEVIEQRKRDGLGIDDLKEEILAMLRVLKTPEAGASEYLKWLLSSPVITASQTKKMGISPSDFEKLADASSTNA
jgi:hypothetical protein